MRLISALQLLNLKSPPKPQQSQLSKLLPLKLRVRLTKYLLLQYLMQPKLRWLTKRLLNLLAQW
jgi:hypothetical protein